MEYLFGGSAVAIHQPASAGTRANSTNAMVATSTANNCLGGAQRHLMLPLHDERDKLVSEQLAVDARWENAEVERQRLHAHLASSTRELEDTRGQLANHEKFLRAQHLAEACRRRKLLDDMGAVQQDADVASIERGRRDKELALMVQSVDAARVKQREAEGEADFMDVEAQDARRRTLEVQRQLDALTGEQRVQVAADALRIRATAASEAEALSAASAASEEIARLRRQLADAEQRSAFTGAAAEAAGKASALTVYGEKLGPSPSDPEHSSRALDEIEAKLAAAAAESDLADDTVIVASRRERAGMLRDLTAAEATAEGMQEEVGARARGRYRPCRRAQQRAVESVAAETDSAGRGFEMQGAGPDACLCPTQVEGGVVRAGTRHDGGGDAGRGQAPSDCRCNSPRFRPPRKLPDPRK